MSESVSQLKVGAALDGSFETVTQTVKTKLKELSNTAKDTGDKLSGMGDGTTQSAQKVEQATKSMVSSIQRTTALMDSGARGSVEYYKALANQRGIDSNVLKPYLDQLEAVKVKQAQASAAMLSGGQSLDKIGMSAAATANALRGVPAQFTDIVTSIQGGQAPLTVFLQQGGQLKDMFGGAGNAAKALGGYVVGLINPFTLLAAGVAATGIAYMKGAAESEAYNKALILTGSAAGVTAGQLGKMAQAVSSATGGTVGAAADALAQLAGAGNIASAQFERVAAVAIQMEKTTGQAVKETVKEFSALGKDPLDASIKLNAEINFLTQSVYEQIKALTEQGRTFEAGALAQKAYADAMNERFPKLIENLGIAERAWAGVGGAAKKAWDQFLNIGRTADPVKEVAAELKSAQDRLSMLVSQAKSATGYDRIGANADVASQEKIIANLKKQADYNANIESSKGRSAAYAARQAESTQAQVEFDKESDKYLSKAVQMQQAIAAAQERFSKVSQTPENLAKYAQEVEGIQKKFEETAKKATTARAAVNQAAKDDIAAARLMADLKTKFEGDEIKRMEKTREELEKTMEAYAKAAEAGVSNAIAAATAAEAELSNYGLLKSEVQALSLVQLEQSRESAAMAGEDVANIEKRIAAQKRLIAATKGVELRTSSDNAAKEAAAEWKRTADSINSTLTDALMRGFESGKDFARNLRDTVVNMFKTLVLRPIISAVINPVAGALTGALGLSGAAQAAGTGSSALSSVGTIAGLASTFGAGLKAGFAGMMGEAGLMGTLSAGTTALGAGNIAGGLGTLGGPLALATAAILGLSAIIKATSGETRNGAKYGVGADGLAVKLEGPSGGEIAATQAQAMFNVAKSSIEGMLTGFGSKAVLTGFTAGLESSENGKGFAYATGKINGKSFGDVNTYMNSRGDKTQEQALKDYQLELTQSILEGLQVTEDIPASIAKLISDGLNGSDVKNLSLEATSAILANVETLSKQVNVFNAVVTRLPFESLTKLSFDTAAGLIAAAGGFAKLDSDMGGFYANFYTAEEQRSQLIKNTEADFKALGLTMPALDEGARAAYRAMVELAAGQDLSVEANAKTYTGLLSLNGAMNSLAPAIDSVAQSAAEAAANMTSAWANVMQSRGVAANDVTRFTAQAAIDAAFAQFKKTDKLGISNAAQFQTITQADFANYSSDNQKLIATILGGFADLSKANTPAEIAQTSADSYTADNSIAEAIAAITKGLTDAGVSLGVELLKAQGKTLEAMAAQRAIDTAGYNAAQVAIYDYNQALRDQITVLNERTSLQDQLDALTMTSAELLSKQRGALDESNRALFDSIQLRKSEAAAIASASKLRSDTASEVGKSADGAMSAVQRAVDAQRKIIQVARNAASESVSQISSVFDILQSSVKELYGTVDSTSQMQATHGRAFITQALATAQATGYLPDSKALTDAINSAKGGTTEFASQFEKDFAALTLAGDLSLMESLTKGQLTEAQKALRAQEDQLAALDDVLTLAQQQLDAAKGINTSVLTVADAVNNLGFAISALRTTTATTATNPGAAAVAGLNPTPGSFNPATNDGLYGDLVKEMYQTSAGKGVGQIDAQGYAYWLAEVKALGPDEASRRFDGTVASIRGYAIGTNYVPNDGLAYLHEGEAVIPKAYNPMAGSGGGSERLESLVEGLTKEVQRLQSIVNDGNRQATRTADATNGRPEMPMLVETV